MLRSLLVGVFAVAMFGQDAIAQPKSETEHLVPPQGGAMEVAIHAGTVCIFSFPEKVSTEVLASSIDSFDVQLWGNTGVAVRATRERVPITTLAVGTESGNLKVNVKLRVVPSSEPALTLVRFKLATAEEAFAAQVKAEVEKRAAPIEAKLAQKNKELDDLIRQGAEKEIARRMLMRNEIIRLESHARNREHVIVHVQRALLFGQDGYLIFEIENRSRSMYRLASVRVLVDGQNVAGAAQLASTAISRDPALIGVVAPGSTARGVVTVRAAGSLLRRPLALELGDGRGAIRLDRGIILR